jgi:type II secretory pathway component GspD/PulD (secretin)
LLFQQESSKTVSRNLAIFLRPTVVSTRNQRAKIVNAWKLDLGDKLFGYVDKEMVSRDPVPVGKRLNLPQLRPKMRPADAD